MSGFSIIWLLENQLIRFSTTSPRPYYIFDIIWDYKRSIIFCLPSKVDFNIKNMSDIEILNKRRRRIEPCGTPDKISSQKLKKSILVLCYGLINNPEVNSRKIYQGHTCFRQGWVHICTPRVGYIIYLCIHENGPRETA